MIYIITGSRDFPDLPFIERCIVFHVTKDDVVFHGGARGADVAAGHAAEKIGAEVRVFHPNWDVFGKVAGCIRNGSMLKEALIGRDRRDVSCLAFWNGTSRGTKDMLDRCKALNVTTTIYSQPEKGAKL